MRGLKALVALIALATGAACGEAGPAPDASVDAGAADASATADAASADAASADAGPAGDAEPDHLTTLTSTADFVRMSRARSVKYILRVAGATPRAPLLSDCYFQNTARYQFHIEWLRTFPELMGLTFQDYQVLVLRPGTRIWWGGGVIRVDRRHPISGAAETLGYQIYAENGAVVGLREEDIVEVDGLLRACIPYARDRLAFYPGDPFQEQLARQIAANLMARGIAVLLP